MLLPSIVPKTFIFAYALSLAVCVPAHAKNDLVLLGGSGDPPGNKTIFDSTASALARFKKSKSYSESVYFNGGHSETEKILATNFSGARSFSKSSYNEALEDLKKKSVAPGDRVVIFVNSHGEIKKYPEKSHSIHCGKELCSLDELNQAIQSLEAKGAQVAVIDGSCYSGATTGLGSDKTCVLTSSRDDSVGYSKTNELLAEELSSSKNKNLEDVFLKAQEGFFGQGNINTEAGRKTRDLLNQFFRDFKNPEPRGGIVSLSSCQINESNYLKKLAQLQDSVTKITGKVEPEFENLKKALHEQQRRYKLAVDTIEKNKGRESQRAETPQGSLSWNVLVNLPAEQIQQQIQQLKLELASVANEVGRKEVQDRITLLSSVETIKQDLRQKNPEFADFEKGHTQLRSLLSADPNNIPEESLMMSQFQILESERTLYRKIYQSFAGKSPCRSFTL